MGRTNQITKSPIVRQPIPEIRKDVLDKEIEYPPDIPLPQDIVDAIEKQYYSYSIWEVIWWILKMTPRLFKILYFIVKLISGFKPMKDQKTTSYANKKLITMIATILVSIISLFGFSVPLETITLIVSAGFAIYGFFDRKQGVATKDAE